MSIRPYLVASLALALVDGVIAPAVDNAADAFFIQSAAREVEKSDALLDDLATLGGDSLQALQGERRIAGLFVHVAQRDDSTFDIVVATRRNADAIVASTIHAAPHGQP
ncbi:MAG TPA: hypothetical protein VGM82_17035 [Gemmatimonadaceae bacterium]|jgi:hypothetical protein